MEKIKSLLHPHGSDKDRETAGHVTHDHQGTTGTAAQSSTATTGSTSTHQTTPIYNQMTGQGNPSSTTGETPRFSNTPNVGAGTGTGIGTGTSTGLGEDRHAGHVGTDGPIGGARDSTHLGDSSRHSDNRPQVSSGAYNGNSEASIKSGVIGFSPGSGGQGHAAMPTNNAAEDRLDRNQIVGQGNTGTNAGSGLRSETIHEQPSTLPVSSSTSSTQQPHDSSRTTDTDRSFPLAGGVTSGHHDHSSTTHGTHGTHGLTTNERELGTKERELAGNDHHGREGLAGAAAAAAGTAAATHGHSSRGPDSPVGTFSDRVGSPTGHSHMTSSVAEHNIHPDSLHAAGARPLNESSTPGHGPPHETPHINTGTLLDYEGAFGSDPHTQHTGLLSYRPQAQRTGTSPHIPGEFPGATPPANERSTPILGGAGTTSGTTGAGPSTSHDLRHPGSLNDPPSRSAESSSGHHLGRDAAMAGGVGAAGLGAATHHRHEAPASGSGNLYDEKNPYSSKALDPRVTGGESRLNEQRFDPSTTSTSRSQPISGSSAPVPPPKAEERQHHYGRDAAIGGGALGAGALAGSALSGDRHHEPSTQQTSSLPTTQHTTSTANPTSFGTTGAPAPRYENTTSTSHQSPSTSTGPQHHYGRDAGLAGAGAATAGGLAYAGSRDQPSGQRTVGSTAEDPASKTVGPHSSNIANILDPRVQPDPAKQKDHTTTGPHQSDTFNRADPKVDEKAGQHHYGRDAAVAGGAGAAGYGAYEAAKAYGDHRSTQPGASMQEQRYDPTASGARAPNPIPATSEYNYHNPDVAALASATGAGAPGHHGSQHGQTQQPYTTAQMAQQAQGYKAPEITDNDLGPRDHSSRNAALGAGAGLAGTAAAGHAVSHHRDTTHTPGSSTQPGSSSLPQPTGSLTQGQQYPHNTNPAQSHDKRDAALLGGAGAAAGAGAGYAYGQRTQPQFDPKEQERLDKETAKHQHELEKKHDKEVHKLEKEHEKDLKKHEKEAAHHDDSEKKGGLLGFLHRDKSKKETSPETSPRRTEDHHYGRDTAVAGGVGAGAAGLAEHEREDQFGHGSGYKGKNLLHKDPPVGHPAREALESGHANDRVGTDGPIGEIGRTGEHHYGRDAALGGGALGAGALGAHELHDRRTEPGTLSSTSGVPGARESVVPGQHSSGLTGNQTSILPDRTAEHHYGRDAALGGGALGAGALGAHELHGRRTEPGTLSSTTSGVPGQHSSGLTANQTSTLPDRTAEHHYGRDAALGGGALGAGGLAAHELHDRRTDPTFTTVGHTGTGLAGSQQATVPGNTTSGSVLGNREQHTPAHHAFTGGKREHIGVDGPIGDPNMISGDRQTQKGVYGAHPVSDLGQDRTVIEPRTGLPMNVGRYGDGAGGTDGGPAAHHHHGSVPGQVQPGTADTQHASTNWEDVAKKNTIY
ncbi:hypothetical protein EKO04_006348 [Ascochyta lentis]|uniref:Uncharacterized protein n=1 Tax=Ascochyta lentis TaxID=205686 RepID=A0A8H7J053_9PLEO|nr:hypothetical protein EKO04_006348 [Ascochyta lentis]